MSDNLDSNLTSSNNITIKKSTYNNLIKGIVAAITVAAFVGGYSIGALEDESDLTAEDLKLILSEMQVNNAPSPVMQHEAMPPQAVFLDVGDDPVKGDVNAPLTVVEFSDFQCPFCSRFAEQTLPLIEENYINTGKVKLVYQDLPLDNIHPNARLTHIAAECADEQGKFWEYHDLLFSTQRQWGNLSSDALDSQLKQYAATLEMNLQEFESCIISPEIANEVDDDLSQAAELGATGTPTFFIGTYEDGFVRVVGAQPYNVFQSVIDAQLN